MKSSRPVVVALTALMVAWPAAAGGRAGFFRIDGIAGVGGDAGHPGAFASQALDFPKIAGSGMSIPKGGGTGSFTLNGEGPGFAALVKACLAHTVFQTGELAFGPERYLLEGVSVESVHVGASQGSGLAPAAPIVVSVRYRDVRDARAGNGPGALSRAGTRVIAAPLLPTAATPKPK